MPNLNQSILKNLIRLGTLWAVAFWMATISVTAQSAGGVRIRDIAFLHGARGNQLMGYGLVSGINGDGLADGFVTASFSGLVAGEYFIAVGGANYTDQINFKNSGEFGTAGVTYPTYGITVSVTAIPEPSSAVVLAGLGAIGFAALRRRRGV